MIILIVVLMADMAMWLGGGPPGTPPADMPPTANVLGGPIEWMPALPSSSLPNVLVLAVMAHESGGRVFATNYNCQEHKTAPEQCSQYYHPSGVDTLANATLGWHLGKTLHTLSEDAGLMQINSGAGWPATPKWDALKMAGDPFDPAKNITAGVGELQADLARFHYLPQALAAYHSGQPARNSLYIAGTQMYLGDYESGPTIDAWTTADWKHQHWQAGKMDKYWIIVSAAGPYGAHFSIPWQPRPPKCTTATTSTTGTTSRLTAGQTSTTTCHPQPPQMLTGRDLVLPASVTVRGPSGTVAMTLDPKDAPIYPGASAWAVEVQGPGINTITATWAPQTTTDPKTGKTHHTTPTATTLVLVAKRGK